jgi:hypothetical protein
MNKSGLMSMVSEEFWGGGAKGGSSISNGIHFQDIENSNISKLLLCFVPVASKQLYNFKM